MSEGTAPRREAPSAALDAAVVGVALAVLAVTLPGADPRAVLVLAGALGAVVLTWFTAGRHALDGFTPGDTIRITERHF